MLRASLCIVVLSLVTVSARAVEFKDALAAMRDNDYPKVVQILDEYLPSHPGDHRAYALRGRAHVELRAFDKALPDLDKAISLDPKKTGNDYESRGRAYFGLGQFDKAIEDLTKAIDANPKPAERYLHRGLAYRAKGDYENALNDFHKAIEIDPQNAVAYVRRGDVQFLKGIKLQTRAYQSGGQTYTVQVIESVTDRARVEDAIADFTKAIELNADTMEAYELRKTAYDALGDFKKAIADLKQISARRPDDVEQLNHLAWLLATHPDPEVRNGKEAEEYAEKACKATEHEDYRFLDTLAAALAETGKFKRAVATQKQAIERMEAAAPAEFKTQNSTEFAERLELYKQNKPYRDAAGM